MIPDTLQWRVSKRVQEIVKLGEQDSESDTPLHLPITNKVLTASAISFCCASSCAALSADSLVSKARDNLLSSSVNFSSCASIGSKSSGDGGLYRLESGENTLCEGAPFVMVPPSEDDLLLWSELFLFELIANVAALLMSKGPCDTWPDPPDRPPNDSIVCLDSAAPSAPSLSSPRFFLTLSSFRCIRSMTRRSANNPGRLCISANLRYFDRASAQAVDVSP